MDEQISAQVCANCGAAGVQSMMTTDRFPYGVAPMTVELVAEVLMFHCLECGETYTGEQGEKARADAVNAHLMRLLSLVPQMLKALKAQHEAIDRLFAMLIAKTMHSEHPFYPSESGQPWEAIQAGKAMLDEAGVKL